MDLTAPTRIIVTGWRGATTEHHRSVITDALHAEWISAICTQNTPMTLVHGACHLGGVDTIAATIATEWGWTVEPHPASDYGAWPDCGPARNEAMCQLGARTVLAFPGPKSRGTQHCIRMAEKYGIECRVYPLEVCP